jgi:hypothetical protein
MVRAQFYLVYIVAHLPCTTPLLQSTRFLGNHYSTPDILQEYLSLHLPHSTMPSSTSTSTPMSMQEMVFMLLDQVDSMLQPLRQRIGELESTIQSLSATPPPAPVHQASKLLSSKDHLVAPTSTPTFPPPSTPTPSIKINSLSSKAAFVKTAVSLLVPDDQAGHVVGRSGAGLKQIHDFSGAKITVTSGSNADGLRTITIRGNAREVGDAVNAIGKRLAHRRIRVKKQHATTNPSSTSSSPEQPNSGASAPPLQKSVPVSVPTPSIQKHIPMVVPPPWISVPTPPSQKTSTSVSTPSYSSSATAPSLKSVVTPSSSSKPKSQNPVNSPTPMSIVTPTPVDSPMHLDVTEARPISTAIRSKPMPKKYRNKKKGGG